MTTQLEKTILQILSIFETGHSLKYSTLTYVKADFGGLSGGIFQASLMSGNLGKMLRMYRNKGGRKISEAEVRQTEAKDKSQNTDPVIRAMFKAASTDQIMFDTQLEFFTDNFIDHAEFHAATMGVTEPLIICLIADGIVHGSFDKIALGLTMKDSQWEWAKFYTAKRRAWLAGHKNPLLRKCVYRMAFFEAEMLRNNWKLDKFPLVVHGVTLNG